MTSSKTKILLVQETHTNLNARESRSKYTWFFSGSPHTQSEHTNAGVAIVVNNELLNYIQDIEPISDRLMYVTLGYTMPITLINVYMPTAAYETQAKENQYKQLK